MKASKFVVAAATAAVIGAFGLAYAQSSPNQDGSSANPPLSGTNRATNPAAPDSMNSNATGRSNAASSTTGRSSSDTGAMANERVARADRN